MSVPLAKYAMIQAYFIEVAISTRKGKLKEIMSSLNE
jgi:hypothetical protein